MDLQIKLVVVDYVRDKDYYDDWFDWGDLGCLE